MKRCEKGSPLNFMPLPWKTYQTKREKTMTNKAVHFAREKRRWRQITRDRTNEYVFCGYGVNHGCAKRVRHLRRKGSGKEKDRWDGLAKGCSPIRDLRGSLSCVNVNISVIITMRTDFVEKGENFRLTLQSLPNQNSSPL